jgi:hypothetical protein
MGLPISKKWRQDFTAETDGVKIQKVSAQLEPNKPAPRTVLNNR